VQQLAQSTGITVNNGFLRMQLFDQFHRRVIAAIQVQHFLIS
jgi:hypothetical protein